MAITMYCNQKEKALALMMIGCVWYWLLDLYLKNKTHFDVFFKVQSSKKENKG
jgi:hypothetical protein